MNVYDNFWNKSMLTAMSTAAAMWINHTDLLAVLRNRRAIVSIEREGLNVYHRSLSHFVCAKNRTFFSVTAGWRIRMWKFSNGLCTMNWKNSLVWVRPPTCTSAARWLFQIRKWSTTRRIPVPEVLLLSAAPTICGCIPTTSMNMHTRFHSTRASLVHSLHSYWVCVSRVHLLLLRVSVVCTGKHFNRVQTLASGERLFPFFTFLYSI